ncbi:hypothetical protein A1Q1_06494 [Trichosporon asahii var. asahii CBS 2479]|uniref:Uncharacterized protein n=1 Tax=Trichosporon asahii var. asahii (strain ATCC 90039 / CBS 2479 / JCM 2466 / KCTC 7840 / NBRC 103889/ NCYC 2677 / UAMH 7654) TaxID=1186058 RepID=J6ER46_TRIAS|nr:hypothetical protein A1Q1_06494 [Trichosporon asahii var. asahii CBS 2479]EJT45177.1 hypothetical protein A1Q1_06494 [Trichosporon asahii var. asahii CBS 2479]
MLAGRNQSHASRHRQHDCLHHQQQHTTRTQQKEDVQAELLLSTLFLCFSGLDAACRPQRRQDASSMAATLGVTSDERLDPSPAPSSKEATAPAASSPVKVHTSPLRPLKSVPPFSSHSNFPAPPPPATPKRNPFARTTSDACASFKRSSLLPPTAHSPIRSPRPADTLSPRTPAAKRGWRLLWRGGLELTTGITFLARVNPGNGVSPFPNAGAASAAAFAAANNSPNLPSDADLSLSLESLRGRKFLQVRGLTLLEDEELDSGDSVQVSITSPLLAAYVESHFSRSPLVGGRTVSGLVVGLGDAGVAPRYFPANPPKKPPPPFPNRRSLSRAASVASLGAAPPQSAPPSVSPVLPAFPVPNGRSPGRRGEKRPRRPEDDDRRRRKAGKIVPEPSSGVAEDPEAIFGRAPSVAPSQTGDKPLSQRAADNKNVSLVSVLELTADDPQACDAGDGVARLLALARRLQGGLRHGHARSVFRFEINGRLDKYRVSGIIHQHLDMYLASASESEDEQPLRSEPTLVDIRSEPEYAS